MLKSTYHPAAPIQFSQQELWWHEQMVPPHSRLQSTDHRIYPLPQHNHELLTLWSEQKELILLVANDPFSSCFDPFVHIALLYKLPFERITLNAIASIATILIHDQRPFCLWYLDSFAEFTKA